MGAVLLMNRNTEKRERERDVTQMQWSPRLRIPRDFNTSSSGGGAGMERNFAFKKGWFSRFGFFLSFWVELKKERSKEANRVFWVARRSRWWWRRRRRRRMMVAIWEGWQMMERSMGLVGVLLLLCRRWRNFFLISSWVVVVVVVS